MTRDSHPQKQVRLRGRKRMIWSGVGALAVLALIIWLGPSRDDIKRKFEFSGKEGPLEMMPELSIDDGRDAQHQDPQRAAANQPTVPDYEVETPDLREDDLPRPEPRSEANVQVEDPSEDPDLDVYDAVEMLLPTQYNPYFRLIRMVRPRYPADATAADRAQPLVTVEVAFFVGSDGRVVGSYIISCTGSDAFREVTLKAVDQWLYEPLIIDGKPPDGFWNRLTLNYRSPG